MRWAILDTCVYIDGWCGAARENALADVARAFVVRHSSVVLSELRRGAKTPEARRLADRLFRLAKVQWAPLDSDWWDAGRLISLLGDAANWDRAKRRDFQNDTLIALTARRHGATVVTSDREDFDLLARSTGVQVLTL